MSSPGFGGGRIVIDTVANTLSYEISFGALSAPEAAAHIHGLPIRARMPASPRTLPLGNPKIGVWNYPQALEADILAGRMYVNIHTAAFPGGEIRAGRMRMPPSLTAAGVPP